MISFAAVNLQMMQNLYNSVFIYGFDTVLFYLIVG